jgi:hypothetical protein
MREAITKIFAFGSQNTYYQWKKQDRPIIKLIEKYFSKEDLKEFLETGEISKFENQDKTNDKFEILNTAVIDLVKFQLKDKIKNYTDGSFFDWTNKMIPKKYLQRILKDLSEDKTKFSIENSKESLLDRIKGLEVSIINKNNQEQISNFIEENLSMIECYVLIQEYENIMNYKGFWK